MTIYACGCGFTTRDISELHVVSDPGTLTHECPNCRNYTGHSQAVLPGNDDPRELDGVEWLSNWTGRDNRCSEC